ncbi:MAG: YidC/Oxa1 family insertase periplasmic-domain containing protein [Pirellulales bacterium]
MDNRRFILFIVLSTVIMIGYTQVINILFPPEQRQNVAGKDEEEQGVKQNDKNNDGEEKTKRDAPEADPDGQQNPEEPKDPPAVVAQPAPAVPLQRVTLGSLDPASDTRMAVTLTNRGAAVERIELNNPRYVDEDDERGYLGHLSLTDGCIIQVVTPGSPAANADLQVGDTITSFDGSAAETRDDVYKALNASKPGDSVQIKITRGNGGATKTLTATLARRPLEVVRPELATESLESYDPRTADQLSFLMTLDQLDDEELDRGDSELEGVSLREENWEITKLTSHEVEFTRRISQRQIAVVKRYRIAQVPPEEAENDDFRAYHLKFDLEIINESSRDKKVAYRLDGPTGLPNENWWFTRKIGRTWTGMRLRDVVLHTERNGAVMFDSGTVVNEEEDNKQPKRNSLESPDGDTNRLAYIGVETQYFAAVLIPQGEKDRQRYVAWEGLKTGAVPNIGNGDNDKKRIHLTNVTSRVVSKDATIKADERLRHSFVIFAGPKRPPLLTAYAPPAESEYPDNITLNELLYYGWAIWGWFAKPLSGLLHFFHDVLHLNYGLAIIMLTVVVRLCMFPLSKKQALNAQKMSELQPEMKRISEKYKKDLEKRSKVMQDLYRKHSYNPLAGCLPLFIQLPIFIGLYRALMVDIELRGASLISGLQWCSNLAAPDMLFRWDNFMPEFMAAKTGWLGPYFNVLPIITVFLFIVQQKMFMPPPTDEQQAMQQKMMKFMMIFFGFMFFTVPSGLCIYFIVSSMWGLGERKFLPKKNPQPGDTGDPKVKPAPAKPQNKKQPSQSGNGAAAKRKKNRKKQKR